MNLAERIAGDARQLAREGRETDLKLLAAAWEGFALRALMEGGAHGRLPGEMIDRVLDPPVHGKERASAKARLRRALARLEEDGLVVRCQHPEVKLALWWIAYDAPA